MAKPNVHTASREELVEAGVRAELAGEILKLRRKGAVELEALGALPGVGPVTLEQLRESLDFRAKAPSRGDGEAQAAKGPESNVKVAKQAEGGANETDGNVKIARQAEGGANETGSNVKVARHAESPAEPTAEAAGPVARNAAEATRGTAQAGARVASIAARSGLETIQRATRDTAELGQATMSRAAAGTTDLNQALMDLWSEQARHNLEALTALSQVVDWEKVVEAQGQFVRASFERITRINRRYLEAVQAMMTATTSSAANQPGRAA